MKSRSVLLLLVAAGLVAVTALAVSGVDKTTHPKHAPATRHGFVDQSGADIVDQAVDAMHGLKSMHVVGSTYNDTDGTISVDFAFDDDRNCVGTVGIRGGTAHVIIVDGQQFLKADEKFWIAATNRAEGRMLIRRIGKRWVRLPNAEHELTDYCDLDNLIKSFDRGSSNPTKGDTGVIDGRAAVQVREDLPHQYYGAWIATGSDHYLLKMQGAGTETATVTFSDFNEPIDATEPAEEDIYDLSHTIESA
jgi:hypothetical protein